jgi:hypothetical protein
MMGSMLPVSSRPEPTYHTARRAGGEAPVGIVCNACIPVSAGLASTRALAPKDAGLTGGLCRSLLDDAVNSGSVAEPRVRVGTAAEWAIITDHPTPLLSVVIRGIATGDVASVPGRAGHDPVTPVGTRP